MNDKEQDEEDRQQQQRTLNPMRTSSGCDERPRLPVRPAQPVASRGEDDVGPTQASTTRDIPEASSLSSSAPLLLLHETHSNSSSTAAAAVRRRSSSSRDGSSFLRKLPAPSSSTQEAIEHMAAVAIAKNHNVSCSSTAATAAVALATGSNSDTNNNTNTAAATRQKLMRRLTTHEAELLEDTYSSIPTLEMTELPRGGISIDTCSVGRVQFGLPPETIKDSMRLGMEVPRVYIVPVERFCREMGPSLGINVAEFEFPAYFNWFVRRKKCVLVVDSCEAECNIRSVFEETLLGPSEFRNDDAPLPWNADDFDASFPLEQRPNFYKEFKHFRIIPGSNDSESNNAEKPLELSVDMLLDFCHFDDDANPEFKNANIGVPSELVPDDDDDSDDYDDDNDKVRVGLHPPLPPPRPPPRPLSGVHRFATDSILPLGRSTDTKEDDDNGDDEFHDEMDKNNNSEPPGESIRSKQRRSSSLYSLRGFASRGGCMQDNSSSDTGSGCGRCSSTANSDIGGGGVGAENNSCQWVYSRVKWLGQVATVWPMNAAAQEIAAQSVPRCEIFCMPGGAEYFVHDVNADNVIVGKLRFSGTVRPPDENSVQGFLSSHSSSKVSDASQHQTPSILSLPSPSMRPPTFYPPSFGVTVLGNSHGFDKNGSTSGYVLWINGRGVMVDPPPYSSATLEREGIRPQLIIGVIITHCHADHDAGAFQKVLSGSRVSLITAPSIYKSFIRKYAALSGLKPSLLRHSHRFRPAIIGQPLRFQGATFHFTFSLHTIPCLAFKVVWRDCKSIVFTGDYLNHPTVMKEMEDACILSKGRAEDLRRLPLQECDILLHEAGAPPIHTPLEVLKAMPDEVKKRLYVVHTSNLPDDCGLRVAPTGTAGTIRLDNDSEDMLKTINNNSSSNKQAARNRYSCLPMSSHGKNGNSNINGDVDAAAATVATACTAHGDEPTSTTTSTTTTTTTGASVAEAETAPRPPLVLQRPADVSDAWFILNLLSNVPFFTSLSYVNTMEVLEIANVQVFGSGEIVLSADRRRHVLCVIWEGTCCEQERGEDASTHSTRRSVWHAGDWSGPKSLQPDVARSDEYQRDIVAVSDVGVKAIMLQMSALEDILRRGSKPYRKYLGPKEANSADDKGIISNTDPFAVVSAFDHVLEVLKSNSVLRGLPALQKRMLESIAEGPRHFKAQDHLWHIGDACENAFLIVSGRAVFGQPSKSPRVRSVTASSRGNIAAAAPTKRQSLCAARRTSTTAGSVVEIMDGRFVEGDKAIREVPRDSEYGSLEMILEMRTARFEDDSEYSESSQTTVANYDAQDRFANRLLARLYATRRYTSGLVFGRGCYLCDTSRMVSGYLIQNDGGGSGGGAPVDSSFSSFTSGDEPVHSSSVLAGPEGCVALVFPKTALVPFLDAHPGLLMSLQGTQVVV